MEGHFQEQGPCSALRLRGGDGAHSQAIDNGHGDSLHRVAHRFLEPGTSMRSQMERFAQELEKPLKAFPALATALMEYALCNICERGVEAEHAKVKRSGRRSMGPRNIGTHCRSCNRQLWSPRLVVGPKLREFGDVCMWMHEWGGESVGSGACLFHGCAPGAHD